MHESPMHALSDSLIPFDEARRILFQSVGVGARTETVPLASSLGRVVARDVRAAIDVPAFDRSAMDGYAVRASDVSRASQAAAVKLRLVGVVHAGSGFDGKVSRGECVQIATGAPIPKGADAVVMVERTRRVNADIFIEKPVRRGENVSPLGGDVAKGSVALPRGTTLTPARLGVLASLGITQIEVYVRPRVGLISTGSELREPGAALSPGAIYDSNSTSLAALLEAHGAIVEKSGIVLDEPGPLRHALEQFRGADLILVTGSSSAGEKDFLAETVQGLGAVLYHGVAVKPGKPLLLARVAEKPILGLAGNPASCLMMAYTLVVPALRRFQHLRLDHERRVRAKLAHAVSSPRGRRHFVPVRLTADGGCESVYKESDATTSIANADGYIDVAEETENLEAGHPVIVRLF
jgi:molybdenum cofactor synthesis domain-containing protein